MPRGPKGERRPADVIRNTVHVMRSTPEEGKDPAEGIVVDRRQLVPGRKRDNQITMTLQRAPCHDQAAICRAGEGRDGALDLAGRARRSGSHPPRARTPRPEWRRTERPRQDWRNPEGQPLASPSARSLWAVF